MRGSLFVLEAVENLRYTGGETHTNDALDLVIQELLRPGRPGYRPSVPHVVIILTDGVPFPLDRRQPTINTGADVQQVATSFAIGVTGDVDLGILALLSSTPRIFNQNYFSTPNFAALNQTLQPVLESVCRNITRMYIIVYVLNGGDCYSTYNISQETHSQNK